MYFANIGAYSDLLSDYINRLGLDFPVYAGKPLIEPKGKYAYFRLESNHPEINNDRNGIITKIADFDFVFVGGNQTASDKEVYEMCDNLSNVFLTKDNNGFFLGKKFFVSAVRDGSQSGVMRENKNNPLLLAVFRIHYLYKYEENPR